MSVAHIEAALRHPSRRNSQAPFWFWNGQLDPLVLSEQLRLMAEQGVHAATPHPRFGMDRREYLEPPFWQAMDAVVTTARSLGSELVLYDEYNWPSGGAGGRVTDGHPEFYPHGLDCEIREVDGPGPVVLRDPQPADREAGLADGFLAAFLVDSACPWVDSGEATPGPLSSTAWGSIAADGSVTGDLPPGRHRVLLFTRNRCRNPSQLDSGSGSFIDFLAPAAGQRFMSLTHEAYAARYGADFGGTIRAIFTDEPSVITAGAFPWTPAFAAEFQRRRGYDLLPQLIALVDDRVPGGFAHRAAYWQTVGELFHDGFVGPLADWCEEHGLALTGHLFEEKAQDWMVSPDLMNALRRFHWPGMDCLGTLGHVTFHKIPSSVARLAGSAEFVCESLGLADGWGASPAMLRRGYQRLALHGVTRFIPHAFFQTCDNPRIECPPTFFHQNPWWSHYHRVSALTDRLCAFNRIGVHRAPVAVYHAAESLWADGTGGRGHGNRPWETLRSGNAAAGRTIASFNRALEVLGCGPWDCDVIDRTALISGRVLANGRLAIGPEEFACVILPAVRTIDPQAWAMLRAFANAGGIIYALERTPERCFPDIRVPDGIDLRLLTTADELLVALDGVIEPLLRFPHGRPADVHLQARRDGDRPLWLLINDGATEVDTLVQVPCRQAGLIASFPEDGRSVALASTGVDGQRQFRLRLAPYQACFVIATDEAPVQPVEITAPHHEQALALRDVQLIAQATIGDLPEPCADGEVTLTCWRLSERGPWERRHGWELPGFDDRDWRSVSTLRGGALIAAESVLLRCTLPPGARHLQLPLPVTGAYALHLDGVLIERRFGPPSAGRITLPSGDAAVLALTVASESDLAGLNAAPRVHCEPFQPVALADWSAWGLEWFSGRLRYRFTCRLDTVPTEAVLDLGEVYHSAEITVNGGDAIVLPWPPYRTTVSGLRPGDNEICVTVANTLANRFRWDHWGVRASEAPAETLRSGLLGPVRIINLTPEK